MEGTGLHPLMLSCYCIRCYTYTCLNFHSTKILFHVHFKIHLFVDFPPLYHFHNCNTQFNSYVFPLVDVCAYLNLEVGMGKYQ